MYIKGGNHDFLDVIPGSLAIFPDAKRDSILPVYSYFEKGCRKKMCTRQSRKVILDMINSTVVVETTFVAFL